ncbi:hypothetical protein LZ30DRAFT_395842 [Colletotrichum cereale]|nr:hypothetical protein LZ30DRAFT_395842 [Colletotrichum cereale]
MPPDSSVEHTNHRTSIRATSARLVASFRFMMRAWRRTECSPDLDVMSLLLYKESRLQMLLARNNIFGPIGMHLIYFGNRSPYTTGYSVNKKLAGRILPDAALLQRAFHDAFAYAYPLRAMDGRCRSYGCYHWLPGLARWRTAAGRFHDTCFCSSQSEKDLVMLLHPACRLTSHTTVAWSGPPSAAALGHTNCFPSPETRPSSHASNHRIPQIPPVMQLRTNPAACDAPGVYARIQRSGPI